MITANARPTRLATRRPARAAVRGAVLVEFALVAFAFYMLIASIVTFGGLLNMSQVAQDAARAGARELSIMELPAHWTFDQALNDSSVKARVYDPDHLVIDLDNIPGGDLDAFFATLPVVNRALRPAMILDISEFGGVDHRLLRFPGALLVSPTAPNPALGITGLTVGVPRIVSRNANGIETIEWIPPVEEVRPDRSPAGAANGPFRVPPPPIGIQAEHGLVALRINIPYQSAAMSSYRTVGSDPFTPNGNFVNEADDNAVVQLNNPSFGSTQASGSYTLAYNGKFGLGRQEALAKRVRPFRRLLVAQAFFRREIYLQ